MFFSYKDLGLFERECFTYLYCHFDESFEVFDFPVIQDTGGIQDNGT